tara:strand:+ start:191164 stop:192333 length:1170 start_codon:yes stop_codon:yes gene_type:complete
MWFGLIMAAATALTTCGNLAADDIPEFKWRTVEIDKIEIGYGLKMADVDGDGQTDIVLADKKTIQWYQNPSWSKHVIAENLTKRDNVCIAARDIDGDGKCEIAVGGQWNYKESVKDGAVFYLVPPDDRTQPWNSVKLYNDPSTHRMHWVRTGNHQYKLMVKPLRGRGSIDGEGNGLRILAYERPADPMQDWSHEVVCDFMHLSHNFHYVNWDDDIEEELIVGGKEGVWYFDKQGDQWSKRQLTENFTGELRDGKLPDGRRFIATIEPMHGSKSAVYVQPDDASQLWQPIKVLDEAIKDGHALACADYLGVGSDQIVVGWRAMNDPGVPGIKLFTPVSADGSKWRETILSAGDIAVEDIKVADLNGDGKTDIVAAARQTKNLVILFNETE